MLYDLPNELSSSQQQLDSRYSWGNMEQNVQQTFKKTCKNLKKGGRINCLNNNLPKYTSKKSNIMQFELATIPGVNSNILNEKYKKTHEVIQSVLSLNNLGNDVKAIEDGTYQGDMLLTSEQSNKLINQIKSRKSKRKKRNGYFIDQMIMNKWPNPLNIPYVLDTTLNNIEKQYIQDALKQIETGTCIKFTNIPFNRKPSNSYILYKKTPSATFCGLSYVGRVSPFNPIYLSFSSTCKNPVGTTIHETLHTLGIAHQHSRIDRDQFIKINWENVNPQFYDMFAISDPKQFSTYGVSYDYYSIMHYNYNIAAIDDNKPTIIPLKQSERFIKVIGQRERLSDKDRELLKIMYCSGTCKDNHVYCGFWALKDFCHKSSVNVYMNNNCKKSCGFCQ
uniref:Metalloendopeptidase n=1 Tax=Strongyloides venezuelensis TaxID=75913 RepID=A0A0K0FL32_STRVS